MRTHGHHRDLLCGWRLPTSRSIRRRRPSLTNVDLQPVPRPHVPRLFRVRQLPPLRATLAQLLRFRDRCSRLLLYRQPNGSCCLSRSQSSLTVPPSSPQVTVWLLRRLPRYWTPASVYEFLLFFPNLPALLYLALLWILRVSPHRASSTSTPLQLLLSKTRRPP